MAPSRIRLGVIGYRNSAKHFHLPFVALVPSIEVHAIVQRSPCSPDAKPGDHCTIDYPDVKHYSDVDAFFADPEIDLVLVCTGAMHYEYAKRALQSNKHVVVEKPFTSTSAEADELVQLSKETGKLATVFQSKCPVKYSISGDLVLISAYFVARTDRRFDGDFLTAQKLIQDGVLGDVLEFESHFDWDDPPWPSKNEGITQYTPGEGTLYGLGAHTVDQAILLFGLPKSVFAIFKAQRDGSRGSAIDDWHTVILQYQGDKDQGVVVTIKSTLLSPLTKQPNLFVRGRKGTYIKVRKKFVPFHKILMLTSPEALS